MWIFPQEFPHWPFPTSFGVLGKLRENNCGKEIMVTVVKKYTQTPQEHTSTQAYVPKAGNNIRKGALKKNQAPESMKTWSV